MSGSRTKKHKYDFYKEDPHCKICGIKTINRPHNPDSKENQSHNSATIDHIIPSSFKRILNKEYSYNNRSNLRLACYKCNQYYSLITSRFLNKKKYRKNLSPEIALLVHNEIHSIFLDKKNKDITEEKFDKAFEIAKNVVLEETKYD